MRLNDFKVKDTMSFDEWVRMIDILAKSVFQVDENGEVQYVPYMFEYAKIASFLSICTEGLELDGDETYYGAYETNDEVEKAYVAARYGGTLANKLLSAEKNALHMIDFEKEKLIHCKKDALSELLNAITKKVEEVDLSALSNITSESIVSAYEKSGRFKNNTDTIMQFRKMIRDNKSPAKQNPNAD